jgi:putative ABC transport system permease protein
MKKLIGATSIREISVSAASAGEASAVADQIAILLRARHEIAPGQEDDFFVRTAEEIADIRTAAMGTMTTLLAGIAGVSLIVGGIGSIMNIMLVSVTERTREIGLRMAIGAKGRDVRLQFLVEAVTLSLLGGGIGIALGFGIAEGMSRWMSWPAEVPANAVAMAFGFAAATGIFFGFYPAQKAARLDPIDALRFE